MKRLVELLCRPALVPLWIAAIAALVLLPDLPRPGLWEPHELAVADAAVARNDRAAHPAPQPSLWTRMKGPNPPKGETCRKQAPDDDGPRTLTERLAAAGLRDASETDGGMRLPLALLGVLCVLATAGIALRLGGGRAGLIAGLACLSFPLLVLDARQLDGDIGTPAAAALIVYGAVALAAPRRGRALALDLAVSSLAIAAGAWLGWQAGGALLGLLVPVGAVAAADGLGLGLPLAVVAARRAARARALDAELDADADAEARAIDAAIPRAVVALLAAAGAIALIAILASQIYDATFPTPGHRELFGKSIIPSDCWSTALGGLWKVDDDLSRTFDSVFETIAFGTFPVGALAPIAILALCAADRAPAQRAAGRLALAWAAAAWIATQVWQRKVGFALWPGFPALAVAIGVWLDDLLASRARAEAAAGAASPAPEVTVGAPPLLAMFVFACVVTIAVDMWAFPDRMASLLIGGESIKYPPTAHLLGLPLKLWVCLVGGGFALVFAAGAWLWRPTPADGAPDPRPAPVPWLARHGTGASIAGMGVIALFWVFGWHDGMSRHLSSKHIFSVYRDLRGDADTLGIMGDMGNAPRYYAGGTYEALAGRDQLMTFLQRPTRVFAMAPASELCAIHRAAAGKPYFVLDDSNPRTLLISNKVDGGEDHNPLPREVMRSEPKGIAKRPPSPIVYDDKIELIGWSYPAEASFGSTIKVTLYFKVKNAVGNSWQIFEHFDPATGGPRFQGDHWPIHNHCATSYWQAGDYVVDEQDVETGGVGLGAGTYDLWIGFFTGSNPNWTNMKVSAAPPGWKDSNERVHLGPVVLD